MPRSDEYVPEYDFRLDHVRDALAAYEKADDVLCVALRNANEEGVTWRAMSQALDIPTASLHRWARKWKVRDGG